MLKNEQAVRVLMKKALIVVTNHSDFNHPKAEPTGLWLSELSHFYDEMENAGIQTQIVSLKGGTIPIDQRSLGFFVLDKSSKLRLKDPHFMAQLSNTQALAEVNGKDFDALYIAGGHGAMFDLENSSELNQLIRDMYEDGKVISAVCHGVAALQNVTLSNGEFLVTGKKGTAFPYLDETIAGVKRFVPYNLEQRLKDKGMHYSKARLPMFGHSVVDGQLITGQNPNSTKKTARHVVTAIGN